MEIVENGAQVLCELPHFVSYAANAFGFDDDVAQVMMPLHQFLKSRLFDWTNGYGGTEDPPVDVIRPEVLKSMEDRNPLTPKQFQCLDLEKVMEFRRAVNAGKEHHEFEGEPCKSDEMDGYFKNTGALLVFKEQNDVPIEGEIGSGKTLIARFIHDYVYQGLDEAHRGIPEMVNCANLGEKIMETQLFGSMEGTYTDARTRLGGILRAYHGTVFLDEVGELSPEFQARLLN